MASQDDLMSQYQRRPTMIRDKVGETKSTTYDLPESDFVFGRPNETMIHDCGNVLSNWV